MQVATPTPFACELFISNNYDTFFNTIYTMLRIYYSGGNGKFCNFVPRFIN